MDSEAMSIIFGLLSAIGCSLKVAGIISKRNIGTGRLTIPALNSIHSKIYSYVFASSTWLLLVLVWFLAFSPYGIALNRREGHQLLAIFLSFPVVVAFIFSLKKLFFDHQPEG